ncbi:Cof-type HAD-IIB family hydrolase [Bacillus tuaregi]|uniref:Cof-type HAD-IIB family hydrolase n=1 Tax=Bacillus tuaregi TaxID=1816695 RepID=UPI0008F8764E|nr:Cof-type HAD-IIB family hydrolase [Bacillus tuaregi]
MKLIATDLDGTLLNEEGKVSNENAEAIKKAIDRGIKFVVVTGRSYHAAHNPLQEAGLSSPIICLNGARIYDSNHENIRNIALGVKDCHDILMVCQEAEMYIEFFTNHGVFSVSREYFMEVIIDMMKTANPHISREEILARVEQRFQDEEVTFINRYEEIFSIPGIEIYKILSFSLQKERLRQTYEKLCNKQGIVITSSGEINLEFNHPLAQKGIALEYLLNTMKIPLQEVMALGDNLNDKSMLERAGRPVAMENAAAEIKQLCPFQTKNNNEHGVALAIEEMLREMEINGSNRD